MNWISVKDEFPPINTRVLLSDGKGGIEVGIYINDNFESLAQIFDHGCGCCAGDDENVSIEYWMIIKDPVK